MQPHLLPHMPLDTQPPRPPPAPPEPIRSSSAEPLMPPPCFLESVKRVAEARLPGKAGTPMLLQRCARLRCEEMAYFKAATKLPKKAQRYRVLPIAAARVTRVATISIRPSERRTSYGIRYMIKSIHRSRAQHGTQSSASLCSSPQYMKPILHGFRTLLPLHSAPHTSSTG